MAEPLYLSIEPYQHGMLDVGDGNLVYWEACGNPAGKPADLRALFRQPRMARRGCAAAGCRPVGRHPRRADPRRLDIGSPLRVAWELDRAWPDASLVVVTDSGHTGSDTVTVLKREALDRFAVRPTS